MFHTKQISKLGDPIRRKSVWIGLSMFISIVVFGQDPTFINYSVADGLPSNSTYGAIQDQEGYIWIYTEKGISKFDGYEFKNFTVADGLPTNDVYNLTEDSKGRIWIQCFSKELCYIKNDSVTCLPSDIDFPLYVKNIREDEKGIWFDSEGFQFQVKNDRLEPMHKIISDTLSSLRNPAKRVAWYTRDQGVLFELKKARVSNAYFVDTALNKSPLPEPLLEQLIGRKFPIYEVYQTDKYLIFNYFDLLCWSFERQEVIEIKPEELFNSQGHTHSLLDIEDEKIKISTYKGHAEFDSDFKIQDILHPISLNSRTVLGKIIKDNERNIWVPTRNEGVYFLPSMARNTTTFVSDFSKKEKVLSIAGKGDQVFWGTKIGKLYTLSGNKVIDKNLPYSLSFQIKGLAIDNKDNLIVGGNYEIMSLNLNEDSPLKELFNLSTLKRAIWDESSESFLLGNMGGAYKLRIENDTFSLERILKNFRVEAIAGNKEEIWVGGPYGLVKEKNGEVKLLHETIPEAKNHVHDLQIDSKNRLWVAADRLGIYVIENEEIFPIEPFKGIIVSQMQIEGDSILWAATNVGLKKLRIMPTLSESYIEKSFTDKNGLASKEVNAVWANDKFVFAGTNEGLTRIAKNATFGNSLTPKLLIKELRINGKPTPFAERLVLNHDQNELEIDFVALSYKSLKDITYQYKLDNEDSDWQTTQIPKVRYPNLGPGNHRFHLKAIDFEGRESELKKEIIVFIRTPWWQSKWFYFLCLLGAVGLTYLIIKMRVTQIKKKEAEKTATQKKLAEIELKALRSQMNPHFVFNSLGAIQYYIRENNTRDANNYLSKFASLMRKFLDSSRKKYVPISKELELIRLYVEMEQIRFENRFSAEFKIDNIIEPTATLLPSMLLQPFVENAINHGLFNKKGKGKLVFQMKELEAEEKIRIIIMDDGIGRKEAAKIKQASINHRESHSGKIVAERINVLNKVDDYNIEISIKDVFPDREETGTIVTIDVPIIN